jgi:hypothetical protein
MRSIVIAAAASLCVVSLAATASADTLVLRDGTRVAGTVVGIVARMITFEDSSGVSQRYTANEVASLEFTSTERRNAAGTVERTGTPDVVVLDSRSITLDGRPFLALPGHRATMRLTAR